MMKIISKERSNLLGYLNFRKTCVIKNVTTSLKIQESLTSLGKAETGLNRNRKHYDKEKLHNIAMWRRVKGIKDTQWITSWKRICK